MKARKMTAVICLFALLFTLLSGCQGGKAKEDGTKGQTGTAQATTQTTTQDASADAEKEDDFSEHFKYSVLAFEGPELLEYPIVKEAMKKFNVEFDLVSIQYNTWAEKLRTMVATGDLPEFVAWYDFNYGEYTNWVKQGVFKELPDLSKYPNIKKELDGITADDYMKVDGKLYCIPKTINANPFNRYGFENFVYRKDWADALGYNFNRVQELSWDEFLKYLRDVRDKDPGSVGKGKLIPLELESGYFNINKLVFNWNPAINAYVKKDGKYVWGTALPETLAALKDIQSLYNEGLISKDFYTYKANEGKSRFVAGRCAVRHTFMSPGMLQTEIDDIKKNNSSFKDEDYGIFLVKSPEGKSYCPAKIDFWAASAYNAKIDDKKMDRMLKIHNWAIDSETVKYFAFGVPEVDWVKTGDGYELKWPKDSDGKYVLTKDNGKNYIRDEWLFQKWFKLEGDDVWIPNNPFYRQSVLKVYEDGQKLKETAGTILVEPDWNVEFFSAPNKNKYGGFTNDAMDAMTKLIISSKDIEKDWANWLKSMESKVNSVLDELNSGIKN